MVDDDPGVSESASSKGKRVSHAVCHRSCREEWAQQIQVWAVGGWSEIGRTRSFGTTMPRHLVTLAAIPLCETAARIRLPTRVLLCGSPRIRREYFKAAFVASGSFPGLGQCVAHKQN